MRPSPVMAGDKNRRLQWHGPIDFLSGRPLTLTFILKDVAHLSNVDQAEAFDTVALTFPAHC